MYTVCAQIEFVTPQGVRSIQIPTFFLNENIQGIVDEQHARVIVEDILNPLHDPNILVHPSVVRN